MICLVGAVTRTIPSNDPVAINYSNTGQSATEVQRARRGFPTSVAQTLDQSSSITTMDFNPVHSTILLGKHYKLQHLVLS